MKIFSFMIGILGCGSLLANYGNAHTTEFHDAINGSEMSVSEHNSVVSSLPVIDTEVWYTRFRVNFSRHRISRFKNKSRGLEADTVKDVDISGYSITKNTRGIDVALGYVFGGKVRTELEYILIKDIERSLDPDPVLGDVSVDVATDTFVVNAYYEFLEHDLFKPYIFAGLGIGLHKSNINLSVAGSKSTKSNIGPAMNIGLGLRYKVINRVYIDSAFRFAQLGTPAYYNKELNFKASSKHSFLGASVGIMFIF